MLDCCRLDDKLAHRYRFPWSMVGAGCVRPISTPIAREEKRAMRNSRPAVVAYMLMLAFAGCATMPPAKPVTSLQQIAGTWEGAGTGPGSMFTIKNYVIKADGTWEFDLPGGNPPHHTGTLQLVDGKLRSRSNTTG